MKTGFFAYSGYPKHAGLCVEEAIEEINKLGKGANLRSWRSYSASGKLVIHDVVKAIDAADYFCADLTGMSDNVLFELGYAIAKNKPLFLLLDTSYTESFNRYKELFFLKGFGYSKYTNAQNIVQRFLEREPYKKGSDSFRDIGKVKAGEDRKALLYLKNQVDTNYSRKIVEKINKYKLTYKVDDPSESPVQSLTWYLEQLSNVPAVLVEFSSSSRDGYAIQNSKCSIICGLAYGLQKELLMVVEEPYEVPIDYRELLVRYNNPKALEDAVDSFMIPVRDTAIKFLSQRVFNQKIQREQGDLQRIEFGDYLAEDESEVLSNYYFEVLDLMSLTRNDYNIVIGRKGAGKTATLHSLRSILEADTRNYVCIIEPVPMEIQSLIYVLESLPENYEKNYLIESTWKFLIYSQIARSVYDKIQERHPSSYSKPESDFCRFVEQNKDIFLVDFSERLEQEFRDLERISSVSSVQGKGVTEFRVKVSEVLHDSTISNIKDKLAEVFSSRERRIAVLVDNLDKAWQRTERIATQSSWILGLLRVAKAVVRDLFKLKNINRQAANISFNLTVFLRSDIFKYIQDNYSEPDKLEYTYLRWNDQDVLYRVIEKRFVELNSKTVTKDELWTYYVAETVEDEPVRDYIYNRILPRPRDLIFFFNEAKNLAARRGHNLIEAEDIRSVYYDRYSSWLFSSIVAEGELAIGKMREFMYELVGIVNVIDKKILYSVSTSAGVSFNNEPISEGNIDTFIDYLTSISLIGREVEEGVFEYEYDFDSKDRIKAMAKRLGTNRLRIHNAFVPYLRCKIID